MILLSSLSIIWILMFSVFKCCWHRAPPSSTIISEAASGPSSSSSSLWDRLPDDVACIVFANLCIVDRVRMMLVCKSWRKKLMRKDIPVAPEVPWRIVSKDSYSDIEYSLEEICLEDIHKRIYRFKLPSGSQWWCCGSSGGWLLMAGREWNTSTVDAEIMLWNPISMAIQQLPALSTLPFFEEFIHWGYAIGSIYGIARFIKRVAVFGCVVGVIFENTTQHWEHPIGSTLALCTPHDLSWSVVLGATQETRNVHISDICFHNGKLYASCRIVGQGQGVLLAEKYTIPLKSCDVEVNIVQLMYERGIQEDLDFIPEGFSRCERAEVVEHLVESSCSGEMLAVTGIQDSWIYCDPEDHGPVPSFRCSQTTKFEVRRVLSQSAEGDCCLESSIGDQTIFVGSNSSLSIEAASVNGVDANCIYYAIDDATCIAEPDKDYRLREVGVFDMTRNRAHTFSLTNLAFQSGSTTGWFTPKLF